MNTREKTIQEIAFEQMQEVYRENAKKALKEIKENIQRNREKREWTPDKGTEIHFFGEKATKKTKEYLSKIGKEIGAYECCIGVNRVNDEYRPCARFFDNRDRLIKEIDL